MRLLTTPLSQWWRGPDGTGNFIALVNVGLFDTDGPAIVPDVMLSLDVRVPSDIKAKSGRSYFMWRYGKPPDVVIEIVSDREGGEEDDKLRRYRRIRVPYYVIHDPYACLSDQLLRIYALDRKKYKVQESGWLEDVGLGLTIWNGVYEGFASDWLRWCDDEGVVIPCAT